MNRYLITGASGFVARHFLSLLDEVEAGAEILCTDKAASASIQSRQFESLDLLDREGVGRLMADFRPTRIAHFASFSSVAESWREPAKSFSNNTDVFLNLLEAVRTLALPCRILSVGSSEEYGDVDPSRLPLREDAPLNPISPYAVARVAQGGLSRIYARSYGLDIVITRSFNHIGPGQRTDFVVPSLIAQFLAAKGTSIELTVGDVAIVRDFLDVRDVARAYHALFEKGRAGETYNVCSGRGVTIAYLIAAIAKAAGKAYSLKVDEDRIRPRDNRAIVGDCRKIRKELGWQASIPLERSIADILASLRAS